MNFVKLQQNEIAELKKIYGNIDEYNDNVERRKKKLLFLKGLDSFLPFALATSIAFAGNILDDKNPFVFENEKEFVQKCTIERDGEIVSTQRSLNQERLPSKKIEFSTAFRLNDEGLYEREFTSFHTEALEKYTADELYGMSKEELEELISVIEKGSIKKKKLDEDDLMYTVDGLYLTNVYDDLDNYFYEQEGFWENLLEVFGILLKGGIFGLGIFKVKKVISKDYIKVKLDDKISSLKIVSVADLDRVKVMVKLRENNLKLFEEDGND